MEVKENRLRTYCRLCSKVKDDGKLVHLQEIVANLVRLNQPFLNLETKSLPQKVCFVCVQSLDVCIQFIDNLEKAQHALKAIFPSNYVEFHMSEPDMCNIKKEWPINQQISFKSELIVELEQTREDISFDRHNSISSESEENCKVKTQTNKISKSKASPKKNKHLYHSSSEDVIKTNKVECELFNMVKSWDDLHWACYLCNLKFPLRTQLVEHSMTTHNNCTTYKCPGCVKRFLKLETFIQHFRKYHCKKLRLSCHVCSKVFDSKSKRLLHEKLHIQHPYTCTGCRSIFPTEEDFNNHVISYYITRYDKNVKELNLEPLCNICNEKFESQFKLKKHLASNHKPKQPHVCDKCGKTFTYNAHLQTHMLVHNNTKGFKCSLCPDSFKLPSSLNKHMIRHKGVKKHCCTECGKSFLFKSQLTTHLITHSSIFPFKCDLCEKSFRLKAKLKTHLRQHTGFKPYKCQVCEREFTDWPNYNKHMVRKHQIDTSKTKRTPQGVIRLANVTEGGYKYKGSPTSAT